MCFAPFVVYKAFDGRAFIKRLPKAFFRYRTALFYLSSSQIVAKLNFYKKSNRIKELKNGFLMRFFMELISRFELLTSSLPRMRSAYWAIPALLNWGVNYWQIKLNLTRLPIIILLIQRLVKCLRRKNRINEIFYRLIYKKFDKAK